MNKTERGESREKKLSGFNPDYNGIEANGLFGLPFTPEESEVVVVPVPWDVTVSYGEGTANGPEAVFTASQQLDLYDFHASESWKKGYALAEPQPWIRKTRDEIRPKVRHILQQLHEREVKVAGQEFAELNHLVNTYSRELNKRVMQQCEDLLDQDKMIALLGGDHSTPLGLVEALAQRHKKFSILQVDAHADLRKAYEGFAFSHASISFNFLKLPQVNKLVQVGVRDISREEVDFAARHNERIQIFHDHELKEKIFRGENFHSICEAIISTLDDKVYISFDIDGLQPWQCPGTGTPVPGGLLFEEAVYLIDILVNSGRAIIGFDLCEVNPGANEWDANVGARMLYKLCNYMVKSKKQHLFN